MIPPVLRRLALRSVATPAAVVLVTVALVGVLLAGCGGAGNGARSSADVATYPLSLGTLSIGPGEPLLTPSGQSTARIVDNAIAPVAAAFIAQVPNPQLPQQTRPVPVTCDPASTPIVQVLRSWTLNRTSGELLVRLEYPASLTAGFSATTQAFSACAFTYATGDFIVYPDQSAIPVNLSAVLAPTSGCRNTPALSVVANGDPSRNVSGGALLDTLFDSSVVADGVFVPGPLCGGIWALSYAQGAPPALTPVPFSTTIAPGALLAADTLNVYAIGTSIASRSAGPSFPGPACPIVLTQPGANASTCESFPGAGALLAYPDNGSSVAVYAPLLYLDASGRPALSLQAAGTCSGPGECTATPNAPAPALFAIDPNGATASAITTDASGYPWNSSLGVSPLGAVDGWLLMGFGVGAPFSGLLWNPIDGLTQSVCGAFSITSACGSTFVAGSMIYGLSACQRDPATPSLCVGTPAIAALDVSGGAMQMWRPLAAGWLPLDLVTVAPALQAPAVPIWFADHALFVACQAAAGLDCANPSWVSLDFASGRFTPVPGLPVGLLAQLVPASP